jgi:hypothetical protein
MSRIEETVIQAVKNQTLTDSQSIENDWVVVNQLIPNYNSGMKLAEEYFDKINKDEK